MKKMLVFHIAILTVCTVLWVNATKRGAHSTLKPSELHALAQQYPNLNEGSETFLNIRANEYAQIRKTRSNNNWQYEGPKNIAGRVNCIAIHPTDTNTLLIGTPGAGIFKTIDGGTTWYPVFNSQVTLQISDIVYQPSNSNIVYAATGDHVLAGYSYLGNGIYKSTDGGETWVYMALSQTQIISKIYADSINPNLLYAAAMGSPFVQNTDRGFYKSTDGGATWNNMLFLANDCGIGDFVVHPTNSQIIYATGRHRKRSNSLSIVNGPRTKIYRSTNGGSTWDTLANGLNYADDTRIGLAISKTNPNVLYALFVDSSSNFGGIYKTLNGGTSWSFSGVDSNVKMNGFGWYFSKIFIAPNSDNTVYVNAVDFFRSTNSGTTFSMNAPPWYTYAVHADKHDLVFIAPNRYWLATDGGVYKTTNGGSTWTDKNNFTSIQFYGIANNPHAPSTYVGGAQDNGTLAGNAAGANSWQRYFGGDGFKPAFDPSDADIILAETQRGELYSSSDGGSTFNGISASIVAVDHTNWEMPYLLSASNPQDVFAGSYRMHLSPDNLSDQFVPISNDLTDFSTSTNLPAFHTITSIAQSSVNTTNLYAGTSDAKVWYSPNYGGTWTLVNTGLPQRYCSAIQAGYVNANTVFCSFTGYRNADNTAHIYKSNNNGTSWTNIAGNLAGFAINDVLVVPGFNDSALVVANDGGVYATQNAGATWYRVGDNMPLFPVFDVELDTANKLLLAGTFAQGIMSIHLDSVFQKSKVVIDTRLTIQSDFKCTVGPNPCTNFIGIQAPKADYNYRISSINGTVLQQGNGYGHTSISTTNIPTGMHTLTLYCQGKKVFARHFVKQ